MTGDTDTRPTGVNPDPRSLDRLVGTRELSGDATPILPAAHGCR